MRRGEIWWADLPEPVGAAPGYRRPVLILQADSFTTSRIATVVVVVLTTNMRLATAPGNVLISARESGLPYDSVINISQIATLDKTTLDTAVGYATTRTLAEVEDGVRLVLDL